MAALKKTEVLVVLQCTYGGYFWCPIPSVWFGVWVCALGKISNFTIFKTLLLCQFSSHFIQTLYQVYQWCRNTGCHFFGRPAQNLKKNCVILIFFLTPDHMQLKISKCYFSHNFHWIPSKPYENIGYHRNSKYLLESCNEKLTSSTQDNILYLVLFKILFCTASSVQAESQGPWALFRSFRYNTFLCSAIHWVILHAGWSRRTWSKAWVRFEPAPLRLKIKTICEWYTESEARLSNYFLARSAAVLACHFVAL